MCAQRHFCNVISLVPKLCPSSHLLTSLLHIHRQNYLAMSGKPLRFVLLATMTDSRLHA